MPAHPRANRVYSLLSTVWLPTELVTMLSKLSDSCLVHLTPDLVAFAISAGSNSGVQVCAEVSQRSLFLDYRIESRAENNRISFFAKVQSPSVYRCGSQRRSLAPRVAACSCPMHMPLT